MKLTVTGPRSVGKSTVSKILARKLKLKYIDGDAEIDKAVQDLGGLYQAMNDGRSNEILVRAVPLVRAFFAQDGFVFDLAGGATVPSKNAPEAKREIRETVKASRVILLLPDRDQDKAIKTLQAREVHREHYQRMQDAGLVTARQVKLKARKSYLASLPFWKEVADDVIYCGDRTPEMIADEIVAVVKSE